MMELSVGKTYRSVQGAEVKIIDKVDETTSPLAYSMGKRFVDKDGIKYSTDGFVMATRSESPFNLVEEIHSSEGK